MIDFNDKDLEDLSDEQKQILDELVTDILNWRSDNIDHTGKLSNDEAVQFTEWLQNRIIEKTSFLPNHGNKLILYSGNSAAGVPFWKEFKDGTFLSDNPEITIFPVPMLGPFYGNKCIRMP